MIYNMQRDTKKDPKGKDWLAIFPEWREPAPVQSEETMFANAMLWVTATEGRGAGA